jgi:hypothetical protein
MLRSILFGVAVASVLSCAGLVLSAAPVAAQNEQIMQPSQGGRFGLGFVLGEPSGVNAKLWQGQTVALQGGLAWSFVDDGATSVYGDFIWHQFGLLDVTTGSLPVYLGAGVRAQFGDDTRIGIRTVVGLDYIFAQAPFDVFLEVVPTFDMTPEAEVVLSAAVGFRYFFR